MSLTIVQVVLLGTVGVGRTSLMYRFVHGKWYDVFDGGFRKVVEMDQKEIELDIRDTSGEEQYPAMLDQLLQSGEAFVMMYSITDKKSFEKLDELMGQLVHKKDQDLPPCIILGNKLDLLDQREVSYEQGDALAKKWKCEFMEISAKHGPGVVESFEHLTARILDVNGKHIPLKEKVSYKKWTQ